MLVFRTVGADVCCVDLQHVSLYLRGEVICFFEQKTAYEMRISDWSSDVCSSDLGATPPTAFCPDKRITAQSAGGTAVVGDGVVKHRGRRGRSPDLRPWERTREGRVVGAVAPTYGACRRQAWWILGLRAKSCGMVCALMSSQSANSATASASSRKRRKLFEKYTAPPCASRATAARSRRTCSRWTSKSSARAELENVGGSQKIRS